MGYFENFSQSIHKEVRNMSKYTDYNLKPFLQDAIAELGFTEPTPIQKEIIP